MIAAGHVGGLSIPRTSFKALVDALSEAALVVDAAGTPVSEMEQAEVAEASATAMHRWAAFNVPAFQSSAPPCRKPLHRISRDLDRLNSPTSTAPQRPGNKATSAGSRPRRRSTLSDAAGPYARPSGAGPLPSMVARA
jgi:hypothetical protein